MGNISSFESLYIMHADVSRLSDLVKAQRLCFTCLTELYADGHRLYYTAGLNVNTGALYGRITHRAPVDLYSIEMVIQLLVRLLVQFLIQFLIQLMFQQKAQVPL